MITCEVSGISVDPEIIWSNTDKNGAVQDSDAGTFVNNRKTSVLSVTLNSAEDTQFLCNIESDETKKLTGTQETASIFVYGKNFKFIAINHCLPQFLLLYVKQLSFQILRRRTEE